MPHIHLQHWGQNERKRGASGRFSNFIKQARNPAAIIIPSSNMELFAEYVPTIQMAEIMGIMTKLGTLKKYYNAKHKKDYIFACCIYNIQQIYQLYTRTKTKAGKRGCIHKIINREEVENSMLQAVLQEPKMIVYHELPVPEPGVGQVLIKVMRIGVCGSDIHVYHGNHKYATLPLVQGHEGSGVVVKLAPACTDLTRATE